MKSLTLVLALVAAAATMTSTAEAQSNAAPSLHTALAPCQVFSGIITAGSTQDISVRGACNIPAEATAIVLGVQVYSKEGGSLKLWEYDSVQPSANAVVFGAGTESSAADVRLCDPFDECFHDISARSTTGISLTLVVEGYFAPPSE